MHKIIFFSRKPEKILGFSISLFGLTQNSNNNYAVVELLISSEDSCNLLHLKTQAKNLKFDIFIIGI